MNEYLGKKRTHHIHAYCNGKEIFSKDDMSFIEYLQKIFSLRLNVKDKTLIISGSEKSTKRYYII